MTSAQQLYCKQENDRSKVKHRALSASVAKVGTDATSVTDEDSR